MSELAYVCLYNSYLSSLAPYTDAQVGRLVRAMMAYSQTGEIPIFKGTERMIWPTLQNQIDRDREAYDDRRRINSRNGSKGGRPKGEKKTDGLILETEKSEKTDRFFSKPKKAKEKENKKEKKNEKENENEKDKENEREIISAPAQKSSPPLAIKAPTAKEVQLYCLEAALEFDPEQFVDYYTAVGWRRGGLPITDWKAAARCWASRQLPERPYDL